MIAPIFSCCLPETIDHFLSLNLWLVNEDHPMGSWEHGWEPWKHSHIGMLRPPSAEGSARACQQCPGCSRAWAWASFAAVTKAAAEAMSVSQGCGSRNKKKLSGDSTGSSTERSAYLFPADLAPASLARILTFSSNQP